jgi:elongation factor P hydroxylase
MTPHEKWNKATNEKCATFMLGLWNNPDKRVALWPTKKEQKRVKTYIKKWLPTAVCEP